MLKQRVALIAGGCSAIVGVGWAVAPHELPSVTGDPGASPLPPGGELFAGPEVTNAKGRFQVEIVVVDGMVTDIRPVQAGTTSAESVLVNGRALPELERRMLDAQTWDVEYVSGASYTSPGIVESAKGAFGLAGLG